MSVTNITEKKFERIAMKFYGGVRDGKRNKWLNLVVILITILPWRRFALSECLEYDNCLWIFGGEGASPDGNLNEYGDDLLFITPTKEVCAL